MLDVETVLLGVGAFAAGTVYGRWVLPAMVRSGFRMFAIILPSLVALAFTLVLMR